MRKYRNKASKRVVLFSFSLERERERERERAKGEQKKEEEGAETHKNSLSSSSWQKREEIQKKKSSDVFSRERVVHP
jgi:hypothetical protein